MILPRPESDISNSMSDLCYNEYTIKHKEDLDGGSIMNVREYMMAQKEVPTVACKNVHQKAVFTNCYFAACDFIEGLEDTLYDYPEDDPEYIAAKETLSKHDYLVDYVFSEGTHGSYGLGFAGPGTEAQKHYRFAGKAFTLDACEKIVKAMGY